MKKIICLVAVLAIAAASLAIAAAPADFPIPSPAGGKLITDGWDGSSGHIALRYPAERRSELLEFYRNHADGPGWRRREMGRGPLPVVNFMNLMAGRNISVDPPQGDWVLVTLTVS